MTDALKRLEELKVEKIIKIHDYVQIQFDDNTILSILNDYKLIPENCAKAEKICGQKVISAFQTSSCVRIDFSNDMSLLVDLSDSAYHGPEAMRLDKDGLPTVVWN